MNVKSGRWSLTELMPTSPKQTDSKDKADTILIYRLGSLGDTIVAIPCFKCIGRIYSGSQRIVLTNNPVSKKAPSSYDILADGGFVHAAIAYPMGLRNIGSLISLVRQIRHLNVRTMIYLMGGRGMLRVYRDLLFFRLCGITNVIGAPTSVADDRGLSGQEGSEEPEAERLARCLIRLGEIDLSDPLNWDLNLNRRERSIASRALRPLGGRPFICANMGGKDLSKDWGEKNWAQLFNDDGPLVQGIGLVFIGGTDDAERAHRLAERWEGPVVNLCGQLSPRESAAVLRHAAVFVGHDSGPMHLAAAAQVPCVALFGTLNRPRKWHPYGNKHVVLHDLSGVQNISVKSVREALLDLLDVRKNGRAG